MKIRTLKKLLKDFKPILHIELPKTVPHESFSGVREQIFQQFGHTGYIVFLTHHTLDGFKITLHTPVNTRNYYIRTLGELSDKLLTLMMLPGCNSEVRIHYGVTQTILEKAGKSWKTRTLRLLTDDREFFPNGVMTIDMRNEDMLGNSVKDLKYVNS